MVVIKKIIFPCYELRNSEKLIFIWAKSKLYIALYFSKCAFTRIFKHLNNRKYEKNSRYKANYNYIAQYHPYLWFKPSDYFNIGVTRAFIILSPYSDVEQKINSYFISLSRGYCFDLGCLYLYSPLGPRFGSRWGPHSMKKKDEYAMNTIWNLIDQLLYYP